MLAPDFALVSKKASNLCSFAKSIPCSGVTSRLGEIKNCLLFFVIDLISNQVDNDVGIGILSDFFEPVFEVGE